MVIQTLYRNKCQLTTRGVKQRKTIAANRSLLLQASSPVAKLTNANIAISNNCQLLQTRRSVVSFIRVILF